MKPSSIHEYLATIGRKGGLRRGDSKRRTPEHYAKMVEARRQKALLKATNPNEINGSAMK